MVRFVAKFIVTVLLHMQHKQYNPMGTVIVYLASVPVFVFQWHWKPFHKPCRLTMKTPRLQNLQNVAWLETKYPSQVDHLKIILPMRRGPWVTWTEDEMVEFYQAVKEFGPGSWKEIKQYLNSPHSCQFEGQLGAYGAVQEMRWH